MNIFCDEAGFTGNNMLDAEQDVFAYCAVAIDPQLAKERVERTIRDFRLQGMELKGNRLVKSAVGQKAITRLLKDCQGNFELVVHLKPFALACKLFEYIFEPVLAEQNSIFYAVGFHNYIAMLLFVHFQAGNKSAERLFADFSEFARNRNQNALAKMFPEEMDDYSSNPLHAVGLFAMLHHKAIAEEVLVDKEPGVSNWILDLTTTSFFGLMCRWGEKFDVLDVVCDDSKPLQAAVSVFDGMIGRREKLRINAFGKEQPFSFNLGSKILLAASHDHPGLQLADVIATAASVLFKNQYRKSADKRTDPWVPLLMNGTTDNNIWPDYEILDWNRPKCFVNASILFELIDRSLHGHNLFDEMPEFMSAAHRMHKAFLIAQKKTAKRKTRMPRK